MIPEIKNVKALKNYTDMKTVCHALLYDMKPNLQYEIYDKLKNYDNFKKVYSIGETIEWETGEDISPESLYYDSKNIDDNK